MARLTLADLTPAERVILRHAVADDGPGIYASPLIGGSRQAVGRYLTEGGRLLPHRDWRGVWDCIVELIESAPELLDGTPPTQAVLANRRELRVAQAEALLHEAAGLFRDGRYDDALALVDKAELAAPTHMPRGASFTDLRRFVTETRDAAQRPAVQAGA